MDEDEIKREMRLWALEVLVVNLFATVSAGDRDPQELLRKTRNQMIGGARRQTFPGFDAATSDFYSAELESAVVRLMDMGKTQLDVALSKRG